MDKTDLIIALCQQRNNGDVKVITAQDSQLVELNIANVLYDYETKTFKLIAK